MIKFRDIISIFIIVAVFTGCSAPKNEPEAYSQSEADQKFIKIIEDEIGSKVDLKLVGKTLWIYLPQKARLFENAASKEKPKPRRKYSIEYLDAKFADNLFLLEYDIILTTKQQPGKGMSNKYTEEYNKRYN